MTYNMFSNIGSDRWPCSAIVYSGNFGLQAYGSMILPTAASNLDSKEYIQQGGVNLFQGNHMHALTVA